MNTYLRRLFWLLLLLYLLATGLLLGVRYVVLPHIDSFRPAMERAATRVLGMPVRIAAVQADWRGLNAKLALADVRLLGASGQPVLALPQVDAVLSWRSLIQFEPIFLYLEVRGLSLSLTRDVQGRVGLSGTLRTESAADTADTARLLRWLGRQREWVLRDAELSWRDERADAPSGELRLGGLQARFTNRFAHHAFGISARLAPDTGAPSSAVSLRGEFDRRWFDLLSPGPDWDARLYAGWEGVDLSQWASWLSLSTAGPIQGVFGGQAWAVLHDGQWKQFVLDINGKNLDWRGGGLSFQASHASLHLDGTPSALFGSAERPDWVAPARPGQGLYADLMLEHGRVDWPAQFAGRPLIAAQARFAGELLTDPVYGRAAKIRRFAWENDDLSLALAGHWHALSDSSAGWLDASGRIERLSLPTLHAYFPDMVAFHTRQWLAHGLRAGILSDASLVLRGNMDLFPFETLPTLDGPRFSLRGAFHGLDLDYASASAEKPGWPPILGASGHVDLLQNRLSLNLTQGQLLTGPSSRLNLKSSHAVIEDLYRQAATLRLTANLSGAASNYLAMLSHSPLRTILAHTVLPQTRASGAWGLRLGLEVPLMHSIDSQVSGEFALQGGEIILRPDIPAFERLDGRLAFDNDGIEARQIQGRFMGGPFALEGALSRQDPSATLRMRGELAAASLSRWLPPAAMSRFGGVLPYQATLGLDAVGQLWLQADSNLRGTLLDFPPPLGKPAPARLALTLAWRPGMTPDSAILTARVGGIGLLQLEHDPARQQTYFWRGALRDATLSQILPADGMALELRLPTFDWPAWSQVIADFESGDATGRRLLPPLSELALQAAQVDAYGARWHDVWLQASQPTAGHWQVQLRGRELDGQVNWRGEPAPHGAFEGHFSRLSWPSPPVSLPVQIPVSAEPPAVGAEWQPAPDWRLPDLALTVEALAWEGRELGALQLRGSNRDVNGNWGLDSLVLRQPGAVLSATGTWQATGPGRGLAINGNAAVSDLGRWFDAWGLENRVRAGHGKLQAGVRWLDFPWKRDIEHLRGGIDVSLDQGRLVHMRSRSAKVLEVLSLQSLSRVLTLEARPGEAFKEGFPFDRIEGGIEIEGPTLQIRSMRVDGPVAQVQLSGGTSLLAQQWDLMATVTPRLDVSGASVAAGLVVNPVVGVSAFLAQWLLKDPLARALRLEYRVSGSWDDPVATPIEKASPSVAQDSSDFQTGH